MEKRGRNFAQQLSYSKTDTMSKKYSFGIMIVIITGLFSCGEDELITHDDYFPLQQNYEWNYKRWISFYENEEIDSMVMDTLILTVNGKVTVDGKVYREVWDSDGNTKLVRREGSMYFGRNHELYTSDFSHEYMFLDTNKPVGGSWSYIKDSGYSKTEYIVLSKNVTEEILNKSYEDVITLKVNYYYEVTAGSGEYELWLSAIHSYAKGVGEVYSSLPTPISNRYGDVTAFIID